MDKLKKKLRVKLNNAKFWGEEYAKYAFLY